MFKYVGAKPVGVKPRPEEPVLLWFAYYGPSRANYSPEMFTNGDFPSSYICTGLNKLSVCDTLDESYPFVLMVSAINSLCQSLLLENCPWAVVRELSMQLYEYCAVGFLKSQRVHSVALSLSKYIGLFFTAFLLARRDPNGFRGRDTSQLAVPPVGCGHLRLHGNVWSWMRPRLNKVSVRNCHIFHSLLGSKKAGLALDESISVHEQIKHAAAMSVSVPDDVDWDLASDGTRTASELEPIMPLLTKLSEEVAEVWSKELLSCYRPTHVPRASASIENPRRLGGVLGYILDKTLDTDYIEVPTEKWESVIDESAVQSCACCEENIHSSTDGSYPDICPLCFTTFEPREYRRQERITVPAMVIRGLGIMGMNLRLINKEETDTLSDLGWSGTDWIEENRPELYDVSVYDTVTQGGKNHHSVVDGRMYHPKQVETFYENYRAKVDSSFPGGMTAAVVALKEAFKIRIITKGPAFVYHACTVFQKTLHSRLSRKPGFGKIGSKLNATDLIDLPGKGFTLGGKVGWSSSDFSGASNGSKRRLNTAMLKVLVSGLPEEDAKVILRSNDGHLLRYSEPDAFAYLRYWTAEGLISPTISRKIQAYIAVRLKDSDNPGLEKDSTMIGKAERHWMKKVAKEVSHKFIDTRSFPRLPKDEIMQQAGTLMGSKTSFPLLSLYVLLVHVTNLRELGDTRSLGAILRGILINGDDRLTVSCYETELRFNDVCKRFGMKLSPGKSYWHIRYANMNSQVYLCDLTPMRIIESKSKFLLCWQPYGKGSSTPIRVMAINLALLLGIGKHDVDTDGTEAYTQPRLIAVINELTAGAANVRMQHVLLGNFLRIHKDKLKTSARGRNLFISHGLGGWGVVPPINWKFHVTLQQQKLASYLFHSKSAYWLGNGPLPGPVCNASTVTFNNPWHNHLPEEPTYKVPKGFSEKILGKSKLMLSFRPCTVDRPYAFIPSDPFVNCVQRAAKISWLEDMEHIAEEIAFQTELVRCPVLGQHMIC